MLTEFLREEIMPVLPRGAFLRRDRGPGLYITNAPMLQPNIAPVQQGLQAAGYCVSLDGAVLRIVPTGKRLEAAEALLCPPQGGFAAAMARFARLPIEDTGVQLFVQGIKCLESGEGIAAWEKAVRRAAALALRSGKGGGGLFLCAMLHLEHHNTTERSRNP